MVARAWRRRSTPSFGWQPRSRGRAAGGAASCGGWRAAAASTLCRAGECAAATGPARQGPPRAGRSVIHGVKGCQHSQVVPSMRGMGAPGRRSHHGAPAVAGGPGLRAVSWVLHGRHARLPRHEVCWLWYAGGQAAAAMAVAGQLVQGGRGRHDRVLKGVALGQAAGRLRGRHPCENHAAWHAVLRRLRWRSKQLPLGWRVQGGCVCRRAVDDGAAGGGTVFNLWWREWQGGLSLLGHRSEGSQGGCRGRGRAAIG